MRGMQRVEPAIAHGAENIILFVKYQHYMLLLSTADTDREEWWCVKQQISSQQVTEHTRKRAHAHTPYGQ